MQSQGMIVGSMLLVLMCMYISVVGETLPLPARVSPLGMSAAARIMSCHSGHEAIKARRFLFVIVPTVDRVLRVVSLFNSSCHLSKVLG